MPHRFVYSLAETKQIPSIGNKARNLAFLANNGFAIPTTYVCTWDAHEQYIENQDRLLTVLGPKLAARIHDKQRYAVRSSANLEDGFESSFAGQFQSVLNAHGVEEILHAIRSIWDTMHTPATLAYLERHNAKVGDVRMAIIIQEMVEPSISGVAFSKNPTTGLDEVLVEAVQGSGEALVQEGITPDRWINKWGTWIQTPEGSRNGHNIELGLIEQVVYQTKEIAQAFGQPVDLEWVYDGQDLKWVQLREITALDIPIYSNRISREVFPGIIKPLIWSVNVPLVNGAWVDLLTELIGTHDIAPESLAGHFYSRAYFNMGALGQVFSALGLPKETLELLMGIEIEGPDRPRFKPSPQTYRLLPRMLRFGLEKAGLARTLNSFLPTMEQQFHDLHNQPIEDLDEKQLLGSIDHLFPLAQGTAYHNIVTPLLMQVYNQILTTQLKQIDVEFEDLRLTDDMPELERYEPNVHLARLHDLFCSLEDDLQTRIRASRYEDLASLPETGHLKREIGQFLDQFGHLSNSGNDFSHQPWRENPDLILQMVVGFTTLEGSAPRKLELSELPLSPWRRPFLKMIYNRARRYRWYREAISSLYTLGYGLFRARFLALGEHFVQRGILSDRDDIFYLYLEEVRAIVHQDHLDENCRTLVAERKKEIERVRHITPPDTIFGEQAPPLDQNHGRPLKGIPTSRGHYTGPARILHGIQDMDRLEQGDVLVIPYSDVGWTPLFTKAGAVIAESGGILSHSSIIAREYGIPAVVSVTGACQIPDGNLVTVNAYRGEVSLHEPDQDTAEE